MHQKLIYYTISEKELQAFFGGICKIFRKKFFRLRNRLPLASSCLRTIRQKLSAASRLPLGGKLLAKQGDEGLFHFSEGLFHFSPAPCISFCKSLSNCRQTIPASRVAQNLSPLAFPFGFSLVELPLEGNLSPLAFPFGESGAKRRERSKSAYVVRLLLRVAVQ